MATQIQAPFRQVLFTPIAEERAWFAVHTCSRHEKQVAQQFDARGIHYFLPLYEESHRWADRRVCVQLPLFPGYVFANISRMERASVIQVPGVARLVSFNGIPTPIERAEIEALRGGMAGGIHLEPHPYLTIGSRVRICGGPMRGVEGVLLSKRDTFRVIISVQLIMRSVSVEIDPADLQVLP